MSDTERPAIPGNARVTMADQMKAASISDSLQTNPGTGAVENPRREFLKQRIASRAQNAAVHEKNHVAWADGHSPTRSGKGSGGAV